MPFFGPEIKPPTPYFRRSRDKSAPRPAAVSPYFAGFPREAEGLAEAVAERRNLFFLDRLSPTLETRMAARPAMGQWFSQAPQPMQRSGMTRGRPKVTLRPLDEVVGASSAMMALGETGQTSSQTRQGFPMAHGRHRPRSTKAVPILMGGESFVPVLCF